MDKVPNINSPNDRERILRFIRRSCKPETCRALQFERFISEIGNRESAEKVLKDLCGVGDVEWGTSRKRRVKPA